MKLSKKEEKILDQIIEKIKNEKDLTWNKMWKVEAPRNLDGNPYSGINILNLNLSTIGQEYTSNLWGTFNKINELGGKINKGEKSKSGVIYFGYGDKLDKITGEKTGEKYPFIKYSPVYNIAQTTLEEKELELEELKLNKPEELIQGYLKEEDIEYSTSLEGRAYYSSFNDIIVTSPRNHFETIESYYSTIFHEITHSTGHESRLERKLGNPFGSKEYAREELIAELGGTFLMNSCGILDPSEEKNSAAYLKNWLSKLENDKTLLLEASRKASKSCKFVNEKSELYYSKQINKKRIRNLIIENFSDENKNKIYTELDNEKEIMYTLHKRVASNSIISVNGLYTLSIDPKDKSYFDYKIETLPKLINKEDLSSEDIRKSISKHGENRVIESIKKLEMATQYSSEDILNYYLENEQIRDQKLKYNSLSKEEEEKLLTIIGISDKELVDRSDLINEIRKNSNGELNGVQKIYFKTDELLEVNFKNGVLDGKLQVYFYEDGNEEKDPYIRYRTIKNYKNGVLDGKIKTYYKSGNIQSEVEYKEGKLNGECILYNDKTGKIMLLATYKDNKIEGLQKKYYLNGNLKISKTIYDNKIQGCRETYYENGKLCNLSNFKDNLKEGIEKIYLEDGILYEEKQYEDGKLNKDSFMYYVNGKIKYKTNYLNDCIISLKEYDETGKLKDKSILNNQEGFQIINNFIDGKLNGDQFIFYPGGEVKEKTIYQDGTIIQLEEFSKNGIQIKENLYNETGKLKKVKIFNEDNTLKKIIDYLPNNTFKKIIYNGDINKQYIEELKIYNTKDKDLITSYTFYENGKIQSETIMNNDKTSDSKWIIYKSKTDEIDKIKFYKNRKYIETKLKNKLDKSLVGNYENKVINSKGSIEEIEIRKIIEFYKPGKDITYYAEEIEKVGNKYVLGSIDKNRSDTDKKAYSSLDEATRVRLAEQGFEIVKMEIYINGKLDKEKKKVYTVEEKLEFKKIAKKMTDKIKEKEIIR